MKTLTACMCYEMAFPEKQRWTMEGRNDAVNLGDDEIVKSTQFSFENYQHPAAAEFGYTPCQAAPYSPSLYVQPTSIRPPQMNHVQDNMGPSMSQRSYGPQNMWPTYGPGYGTAMHPMHHLVGNGMYSPFPPLNYNGMASYGGGHAVPAEAYVLSQAGPVGSVHRTSEWRGLHSNGGPVPERFQRPTDSERTSEANSPTVRPRGSGSGPWISSRPPTASIEQQRHSGGEMNFKTADTCRPENSQQKSPNEEAQVPLEVRPSPTAHSEDTLQGPDVSASIEGGQSAVPSLDAGLRSQSKAPSQPKVLVQQGMESTKYWKSPEGTKECNQNKLNASAEKVNLKGNQADCEQIPETDAVENGKGPCVPEERSAHSDPLGFDSYLPKLPVTPETPVSKSLPSVGVSRNPMADISNQLHDAVDSILSNYEATCGPFPKPFMKTGEAKGAVTALGSQSQRTVTPVTRGIRTTAEVLSSLQRPRAADTGKAVGGSGLANRECHSCIPGSGIYNRNLKEPEVRGRKIPETFGPTGSARDSSCPQKVLFKSVGDDDRKRSYKQDSTSNFKGFVKDEAVELSSDDSSEEQECSELRRSKAKNIAEVVKKSNHAYTEELEEWPCEIANSDKALGKKAMEPKTKNGKDDREHESAPPQRKLSIQKSNVDEKKSREVREREGSSKGNVFTNKKQSLEVDVQINNGAQSKWEAVNEDAPALNEESDEESEEEPPVLPRQTAKRKITGTSGGTVATKDVKSKGARSSGKAAVKKQKDSQIDPSVLKNLQCLKRPKNANPIKNRVRVWVLHPDFVGKVVAEAFAGINRKSRCVDSANEMCKEGQQMISVIRILYKNIPVMFDVDNRFPRDISYLDQVEGLPNSPILWCISHIIEIPPIEQITRQLAEFIKPKTAQAGNSDSDFEDSRARADGTTAPVFLKERRKERTTNVAPTGAPVAKSSKTVLRTGKA